MTRLANSFEGGTNGVTITTGNSGGASGDAFQDIQLGSGTIVYDSANAAHGGMAATFNPVTAVCYVAYTTSLGTLGEVYGRCYVKLASLPPVTLFLVRFGAASSVNRGFISIKTDGTVGVVDSLLVQQAVSTNALTAGSYARLEWHFIGDPTVGHLAARIFLTPDSTSVTETVTASNINTGGTAINYRVGMTGTGLSDMSAFSVDDLVWDTADYPGPAALRVDPGLIDQSGATLTGPTLNRSFSVGLVDNSATTFTHKMRKGVTGVLIDQSATTFTHKVNQKIVSATVFQTDTFQEDTFQGTASFFIDQSATTYEPRIGLTSISPDLIDNAATLFAPDLTVSSLAQIVTLDNIGEWDSPTVLWDSSSDLWDGSAGVIALAATTFSPSLSANTNITPDLIDQSATTFAPSPGASSFSLPIIDLEPILFLPQVDQKVSPDLIDQSAVAVDPTYVSTGQEITPDLIDNSAVTYAFQLNPQEVDLNAVVDQTAVTFPPEQVRFEFGPAIIDNSATTFAPSVGAVIFPDVIDQSAETYIPSLERVMPDLIDNSADTFEPFVSQFAPQTIRLDDDLFADLCIDQSAEIFPPDVGAALPQFIFPSPVDQTAQAIPPIVFQPVFPRILKRAEYMPTISKHGVYVPTIRKKGQFVT